MTGASSVCCTGGGKDAPPPSVDTGEGEEEERKGNSRSRRWETFNAYFPLQPLPVPLSCVAFVPPSVAPRKKTKRKHGISLSRLLLLLFPPSLLLRMRRGKIRWTEPLVLFSFFPSLLALLFSFPPLSSFSSPRAAEKKEAEKEVMQGKETRRMRKKKTQGEEAKRALSE